VDAKNTNQANEIVIKFKKKQHNLGKSGQVRWVYVSKC